MTNDISDKMSNVRTRFPPSPTGPLNPGSIRTALFSYLFAKRYGGKLILRIEDTDVERSKKEWDQDIIESMKWLGLNWDEGPNPNIEKDGKEYIGEYGPYRQSERKEIYVKYLKKLVEEEKAYYCFCSKEELESYKQYAMSQGLPPVYPGKCRDLDQATIQKYLDEKRPFLIRFKTPKGQKITFNDAVRGKVEFDSTLLGDFSLSKGFDNPLYNFVVVIDDYEMKITDVVRGEDHISNTPKQILLQEALGLSKVRYAHLPLLLNEKRQKLSKRDNVLPISAYKKEGYFPEALNNFVALLGWNPGTEEEVFSLEQLAKEFSVEKIQKAGAIFNPQKLDWLNGFYIRQKPLKEIAKLCIPYLEERGLIKKNEKMIRPEDELLPEVSYSIIATGENIFEDYLENAVALYKERLKKLSEIGDLVDFLFAGALEYPAEILKWKKMTNDQELIDSLKKTLGILSAIEEKDFTKENLEKILLKEAEAMPDRGYLLWPMRAALTGKLNSAGPIDIAAVLGKQKSIRRIEEAINKLK
ncbi:MAG: glutamate--tRNA ligase [Candidatus Paceibacterota bacterium]|jgi:nondiscriminating glutamyl-tRNA synthetase